MRAFTQLRGLVPMRSRGADQGGFTLVELVIAMGVILATLTTMVATTVSAFSAIGVAKQRQVCTGLADEIVEQVRGLPFATLTRGLGLSDLQAGGDSAITSSVVSGVTTYYYKGEPVPTGSNPTTVPLVPHTVTKTVTTGTSKTYTIRNYLTYYRGSLIANTFRLTVDASCPGIGGTPRHVVVQTVVYQSAAPGGGAGGCPFNAPCTSHFFADAGVSAGNVDVTPTAGSTGVAPAGRFITSPFGVNTKTWPP